jgi:apolipoprotein N-acyltransferase
VSTNRSSSTRDNPARNDLTPGKRAPSGVPLRIVLTVSSSALLFLAFPPADLGFVAWIALVPFLVACSGLRPRSAFFLGLLNGTLSGAAIFYWTLAVPGFKWYHMAFCCFYFALYPAVWAAFGVAVETIRRFRFLVPLSVVCFWVALDYIRGHAGFLSLPWASLAHSQHAFISLLQCASLAGEYGVTFLVVLVNVALYRLIWKRERKTAIATAVSICAAIGWGFLVCSISPSGGSLRVSVVQPNIVGHDIKACLTPLMRLSTDAAAYRPSLLVWPESAVRNTDVEALEQVISFSRRVHLPILTGVSERAKFQSNGIGDGGLKNIALRTNSHNSAFLVFPDGTMFTSYKKQVLVPFGEYLPLEGWFKWPSWLVPSSGALTAGRESVVYELSRDRKIGPLICWENLFPVKARTLRKKGADIVAQMTNDNWFGRSAAPFQHNLASVLRAVENGVPFLIASNTGPSEIIDAHGRVIGFIPPFREGFATASVRLTRGLSLYGLVGDVFAWCAILLSIVVLTMLGAYRTRQYRGEGR